MNANELNRRDAMKVLGAGIAAAGVASVSPSRVAAAAEGSAKSAAQGAGVYQFKVGDIEAALVSDGTFDFPPGGYPLFGANASKEQVGKALDDAFIPQEHVVAHVNCLMLRMPGGKVVLIDSGCGSLFGPTTGKTLAHLASLGVQPADVSAVVITHAHGDHVGGLLGDQDKLVFPQAQHFIHESEQKFWADGKPDLSHSTAPPEMKQMIAATAAKTLAALKGKLEIFGDKKRIVEGIEVVPAPGHTPGHIGLLIASGNSQLLYVTDAAHHYALNFPHPDWHVAYDTDPVEAAKSRKMLLDRAAADRVLISGAHLPFPATGHVKAAGSGFEWMPSVWEWAQ